MVRFPDTVEEETAVTGEIYDGIFVHIEVFFLFKMYPACLYRYY